MIVTYKRFGRLGNRLFLFSHLIAFSEYSGIPILNFAFSEYNHYFPFFKNNPNSIYWNMGVQTRYASFPVLRIGALVGLIPTVKFWDDRDIMFDGDDALDPRIRMMKNSPYVIFEGWRFRSNSTINKIAPKIKEIFAPQADILLEVSKKYERARQMGDVVVGVHIRWEDYRGTEYFFPLAIFLKRMDEISAIFSPSKVSFIICSPEQLKREDFPNNCILAPNSGSITDMYTLAACDYILGPPSTFSGWASFYGKRPVFTMRGDIPFTDLSAVETW
jgi:hypothetical protein